jgi:Protein of unknown function (DUF3306)
VSDEPNGALSRWSQRKLAARRGAVIDEPPREKQPVAPASETAPAAIEQNSAAKAADPETEIPELPPIDELTFQSDFTGFLHKNVPEVLRRAALRKLWASDPVLANLDGLNDYCEDFNVIDTPITLAQTGYKVGKGYLDEVKEAVAELEGDNAGKAEAKSRVETLSAPAVQDDESSGDAPTEDEGIADGSTDESRQLAAVTPEADEVPGDSGKA